MQKLLVIAALAGTFVSAAKTDDRLTLAGAVQDDKGKPLAGATVFISTAGPRQGVGVL